MFTAFVFFALVLASGFSPEVYADTAEAIAEPIPQATSKPDTKRSVLPTATTSEELTLTQDTPLNPKSLKNKPRIAIIIDDLGHNYQAGAASINLKAPVAVAVLPFTPHSKKLAKLAHKNKQVVMLHLPMQPGAAMHLMTDKTLSIHMMREDFEQLIHAMIEDIPHVTGVNNHMGSLFTQLPDQMQWLMNSIQSKSDELAKDLFFVDSLTSPYSVAYQVANENNIASARRDVFLDNQLTAEHMQAQIKAIKRTARTQGYAIAIGHPFPETLALLEKSIPELEAQGFEFVEITELLNTNPVRSASIQQIDKKSQSGSIASSDETRVTTDKKKIAQVIP